MQTKKKKFSKNNDFFRDKFFFFIYNYALEEILMYFRQYIILVSWCYLEIKTLFKVHI